MPSIGIALYIEILIAGLATCAVTCTIPTLAASLMNFYSRALFPPPILKITLVLLLYGKSVIFDLKYPPLESMHSQSIELRCEANLE